MYIVWHGFGYRQLRARRALSIFKDVPLRTSRVLSLYNVQGDSALLDLNRTSLNSDSALLAFNWRYAPFSCHAFPLLIDGGIILCHTSHLWHGNLLMPDLCVQHKVVFANMGSSSSLFNLKSCMSWAMKAQHWHFFFKSKRLYFTKVGWLNLWAMQICILKKCMIHRRFNNTHMYGQGNIMCFNSWVRFNPSMWILAKTFKESFSQGISTPKMPLLLLTEKPETAPIFSHNVYIVGGVIRPCN